MTGRAKFFYEDLACRAHRLKPATARQAGISRACADEHFKGA
ncbi:hypothetical protein [Streptomyces xantholiticus]|uniref:Uncharacterized protein n=1 Tax=Streptomyces xantholiticus TaxID=68285 RepID=A0ABV1UPR5_9ACTN